MSGLDYESLQDFELELVTVNYIRECRSQGMSIEEILNHLELYLDTFTWD